MKKSLCAAAIAFCSLAASPVWADDALYQTFGQKPGLVALMDDFMLRLLADKNTGPFFAKANQQRVKEQLVDQFCQVMGGPCVYKGVDMVSSHSNLDINKTHFNALVEVLQATMDEREIPFRAQNQLLARLAPMNRDIITVK